MTDSEATASKAAKKASANGRITRHPGASREQRHRINAGEALAWPTRAADASAPDVTTGGSVPAEPFAVGGTAVSTATGSSAGGIVPPQPHGPANVPRGVSRPAAGLEKVTVAVLAAAGVLAGHQVIDLGCGSGQLSLALAERGARVLAIDANRAALDRLRAAALQRGLAGLEVLAKPVESLTLPIEGADLIVTSYALHRLRDADKELLVAAAFQWLRPGGTFIVSDMMFGRGGSSQDRAIIRTKVRSLARKGIGGWWRIAKNSYRYLFRVREHPMSISAWTTLFASAGFTGITASRIINEAGLVAAKRPGPPPPAPTRF
jgi:2-polyprenyl-3-methyl-5-hydroxy-6-metoxy-1,4-benzoquinol methylase